MRTHHILFGIAFSVTASIVGCAVDQAEPGDDAAPSDVERRQKIGKADLYGSCAAEGSNADKCGAKGTGNCWCDKACVEYGDCCSDFNDVCGSGESGLCEDMGGTCLSSPIDVTFGANCEADYGMKTVAGACAAFNQSCCKPDQCLPVLCALFCENGFAVGDDGCPTCACADEPTFCGGFGGIPCPEGKVCVDDPNDDCDPQNGGADCGGMCIDAPPPPPPAASCENKCGSAAPGKICYCDALCTQYNDCCDDYEAFCSDRTPASGMCVKNSNDACTTDADCVGGGCGGELCYNPAMGSGISTCECTAPQNVDGCGCVAGKCTWYN